jgi:hypothetical protein
MSLFGQTLVLYLVVGTGMAVAVYLAERAGQGPGGWFLVASTVAFWPLYLPLLLASGRTGTGGAWDAPSAPRDALTAAISQVDDELGAALGSPGGWAEEVLVREKTRLRDLRAAWLAQARRIREMDQVLTRAERAGGDVPQPPPAAGTSTADERLWRSRQARYQNVERLRRLRRRAHDDLMGSLARVRELVSMIHLAKFSGAPAARAEELVAQIAAAVEGLSELAWQEETTVPTGDGV